MMSRQLIDLTAALITKEIKSKYKSATLGFLWVFVNPLLQMIIMTIVFSFFLRFNISNYPLFVFSGLLPWTYFSLALTAGTNSLVGNRDLIRKVPFQLGLLPISAVLAHLVTFLAALCFLCVASVVFLGLRVELFLMFPVIAIQTILLIGITLLTSSLDIYYRDVSFIVQAVLIVWFYLTPVFYAFSLIPTAYHMVYMLNPMAGIIMSFQTIFWGASFEILPLGISAIWAAVLLAVGVRVFDQRSKYFADWI